MPKNRDQMRRPGPESSVREHYGLKAGPLPDATCKVQTGMGPKTGVQGRVWTAYNRCAGNERTADHAAAHRHCGPAELANVPTWD